MLNKVKKFFLWFEDKFPFLGKFIISFLRFLRFHFYYKPVLFFINLKKDNKDLFKVYWVSPDRIKFYCVFKNKINLIKDRGKVMSGDWDLSSKKFEDNIIYKGIKERFVDSKEWKETIIYRRGVEEINQGKIWNGCNNKEKLERYFEWIDRLYESIKQNGYIPNYKIKKFKTDTNKTDLNTKKIDEIKVAIGRNGQILFIDGAHRLAIAKVLEIEKVAVRVFIRHKKWVKFKSEMNILARIIRGKLYQPAYHFDLADIPHSYGNKRFLIIKDNLGIKDGSVLDIGANIGYLSHRMEEMGFRCTAVEINLREVYIMKKLRNANNNNFKIVQDSIFKFREGRTLNFDIVLALNIFHHFLKRKVTYGELKKLLNRINCKEMFLETHNPKESQMKGAFINYQPEEFVKFIIKNSNLNKYLFLKELEGGRKLYKIFR
jgi:2-polyprenyl-3-methyl-5-hydroxy-6-metoxy-1,4-benzoquinol methylase